MITQRKIGLDSRSEANPFDKDGFLPLITAPMYSVVDESNYQLFLDNKVQVCLPRADEKVFDNKYFTSVSLDYFRATFVDRNFHLFKEHPESIKVCIDTANGNMPLLHSSIREAKIKYKSSLIIMAGNVGSVEAFVELAKTGCDYIRVGIGGGGGCNTTSNTGVGQENLFSLIAFCSCVRKTVKDNYDLSDFSYNVEFNGINVSGRNFKLKKDDINPVANVKIVADGISSYINYCQKQYNFNDNGYAAINKLLDAGADLVMVGKLFAQCVESAGEKALMMPSISESYPICTLKDFRESFGFETTFNEQISTDKEFYEGTVVKYSGMSTEQEQVKYKNIGQEPKNGDLVEIKVFSNWSRGIYIGLDSDKTNHLVQETIGGTSRILKSPNIRPVSNYIKPSEGSVQWIPVRWTLDEWLNGSNSQDTYPYLMGWVNSIRSMMAYTNKTTLQ